MTDNELVQLAVKAMNRAYAPYSGFKVGAAVVTGSGKVYTGVNIENASFGATNCAERTAIFKAVSEGERDIAIIAVAGDSASTVFPCGICRQVISEFATKDARILCSDKHGNYREYEMEQLLPHSFNEIPAE